MGRRTIKRGVPAKSIRAIKPDTRKTLFSAVSLRQQLEQHARELDEARDIFGFVWRSMMSLYVVL